MNVNHSFKSYQRVIDECDVTKLLDWNLSRKGRMQFAPTGFWLKSKRCWSSNF
jgi:hypothetical protein